jgi:formyl-CoA transferase
MPQLNKDVRFTNSAQRIENREALREQIAQRVLQHGKAHWLNRCREFNVPSGPINNMQEVFEDPAVIHRGIVVDVPTSSGAFLKLVRNPMRFAKTPVEHHAPPELGADTDQVLAQELNLDKAALDALKQRGVI